jgi:hypothetical protein
MSDKALLLAILIVNDLAIAAMFIAYNSSRFYDLRRECAERVGLANAEVIAAHKMVKRTEAQARVMGAVPVSKLIGDDDE